MIILSEDSESNKDEKEINTRQHWIRNNLKDKKIKRKIFNSDEGYFKSLNFDIFYFIYLFNNFN